MITRVAFVINKISSLGGAERVMSILCSEFAKRNIDVKLIVQESLEKAYPIDNTVNMVNTSVSLNIPVLRLILRQLKLRKQLKLFKPEIVISFMTDMNILAIVATFGLNIPVIVSERSDPKQTKRLFGFFRNVVYPFAKGYVFQTTEARDYFSLKIKEKSRIIPNPICAELPERNHNNITHVIVTIGRLTSQKNHRLLIEAFSEFRKTHRDYTLNIYGDGPLKNQLEKLIYRLGIEDAVVLMGTNPNVLNLISEAEMFVLTSSYEGMSNALAEALAIGIPCISTDCSGGGPSFLIKNDINGILVPPGNKEKLIAMMDKLAVNSEFAQKLGDEAKKVKARLAVNKITEEWIDYCMTIRKGE
jgi:GalNAc-alpha-(1->4)-GalNAc-alpha-(1->3)-diNAcBac-PP-undecaprenol alpha-1,4-N-acetyl-D-galactosaminyltransferase